MKKRYLIIAVMLVFSFITKIEALTVGDCEVLVSFKQNSSLDDDTYICKGKKFGGVGDSIYYSGEGSTVYLNGFNGFYLTNNDATDVALNITGENNISIFHVSQSKVKILGNGSLKFKEGSYVKKVINGEAIYNYLYNGKYVVKDNKIFEGTNEELEKEYELLKDINKLPREFDLSNFQTVQVIDFTKMTPLVITENWLNSMIDTDLSRSVVDGYGVVKHVQNSILESDDIVFVSEQKVDSNYELKVINLKEEYLSDKVEKILTDLDLLNLYDISVYNGEKEVVMNNGVYTIKIKLDNVSDYSDYQIIYVNDNGDIQEYIDASIEDDYIVFKTSHLSHYGVIAKKNVLEVNNDLNNGSGVLWKCSILVIVSLLLFGLILFVVIKFNQFNRSKKKA